MSATPDARLSLADRRDLRELGWRYSRSRARRPPRIRSRDILAVGDDVRARGGPLPVIDCEEVR
jgi:hypothetical protein